MGDKVSWKSLVGLNGNCDVDDGSLSPVFVKNKWVILNKSTNIIVSNSKSTSDKEESHKVTCSRISGSSDGRQGKRLKLTDDENIIYSPTRVKRKSIKRKSFEFPLKSSSSTPATFSSSSPAHKKSKTDINDYGGSPITSSSTFHRIKRNILYSTSDEKKSKSTSNIVNINDIYQSIIMMDEADKSKQQPSGKANVKKISSDKQFTSVSSLNIKEPSDYKISRKKSNLKNDISPKLPALNDSLNNFSCTEVEEIYNIRSNRSSKALLGFEGILFSPVEISCSLPKLEVNIDLVSNLSSAKIPEGDHESVYSHKKSFNSPKVSDLNRTSPTCETNFETANVTDIKDIQVNPETSSSVLNVQPKVNLNIEDSVRFDTILAPLPRIIEKFELSEENLNHPEAPKLDENGISSRKKATSTDEALKIDEHFEIKKSLPEDESRDMLCPTKQPFEDTSPNKSHLCSTNFPNSEFLRDVDITCVIQVDRQDRRSLDPEGESTEGTDSSKTKVENLLQNILDKPSGVPIQRLLSTDFLDLKSTVVQFSTAGGAVVTASQESLDKAKALLQDVLNECDTEESMGKEEVNFETSPGSKIIECDDAGKKAQGLLPDKQDESMSRSVFHDKEHDTKESSSLKNLIDGSESESQLPVVEIPLACPNVPPSNSESAENETIQGMSIAALSSESLRKLDECISHISSGFTTKKPTEVTELYVPHYEKNEETTNKPNVESIPASADNSSRIQSNKYYFASTSSSVVDTSSDMCSLDESSSQENYIAYNHSGFSEVDFSTENFIPHVELSNGGRKPTCFTPTSERVSPLFGTPLQNLKLNSNKKLLSLSSRSQGRRSSPVENLTPRVANLKIQRSGPQKINKSENSNTFQENLRRTKYKEDIKSLECKHENSLQGAQLTQAEKPGRRSRKVRNSDKISKTVHETKFNTTRYNLRSAKKHQNQDTSPDINENKTRSIVKSPAYELEVNFLSTAKGDSVIMSDRDKGLKTVKNIFKEDIENISPNKRDLKDSCNELSFSTAKHEEVNVSQESTEKVKIHFINELNHSGNPCHDNSLPRPTSPGELPTDFTTCASTPGHFEGKSSARSSSAACIPNPVTKENLETSYNFTLLSQDGGISKEDFKIIQDNEKTSHTSILLPIDSNELPSNKPGEIQAPSEIEKCSKTPQNVSPQNDCRKCEMVNTCKVRVPLLDRPHIYSQRYEKEDDTDKVGHHLILSDCKMTFSTASGKNIQVSEASLLKAGKMMKEEFSVSEWGIFSEAVKLSSNDAYKNVTNVGSLTEHIVKEEISSICNPPCAESVSDVPEKNSFTNFVEANCSETPYVIFSSSNDEIRGFNVDDANNKDVIAPEDEVKSPKSNGSVVELITAPNSCDLVEIMNNSPDTSQKRKVSKLNRTLTSCMLDAISMVSSPNRKRKNSSEMSSQRFIEKCIDQDLTETQTGLSDSFFKDAIILTNPDEQFGKVGNEFSGKNEIPDNNFCHGVNPHSSTTAGNKVIVSEESELLIKNKIKDDFDSFNEQCCFVTKNIDSSTIPEFQTPIIENKSLSDTVDSQILVCDESVLADRVTCVMISDKNLEKVENDVVSIDRLTPEVVEPPRDDAMFTTAGGKSVILSEQSLLRAKNLFSDDLGYCESFPVVVKPDCELGLPMFPTAGGNLDSPSEGSLQNVRSNLGDDLNVVENVPVSGNLAKPLFSTAGGNQVNISEESLRKVRNIFSDEGDSCASKKPCVKRQPSFSTAGGDHGNASDECPKKRNTTIPESSSLVKPFENVGESSFSTFLGNQVNISKERPQIAKISCVVDNEASLVSANPVSNIPVFSNANGKRLHISEESLNKVRNIFGEDLNNMENSSVLPKTVAMSGQPLFSTAVGNQRNVSEESLKEVRNMMADDLGKFENSSASTKSVRNLCQPLFSTAGGKRVKISEESMNKVKNIFGEDLNKEESISLLPEHVAKSGQPSFSTSGGKRVNISEESMNKVKNVFGEDLNKKESISLLPEPVAMSGQPSFSTAGGKRVNISEENMNKVKNIFGEDLNKEESISLLPEPVAMSGQPPFSTAGGKRVNISEESMNKVKNVFGEDLKKEESISLLPEPVAMSGQPSFSTAGGKRVNISEESMNKVKNIFGEDLNKEESISLLPEPVAMSGQPSFSTAGGNQVNISEESLNKVRIMFSSELSNIENASAPSIPIADSGQFLFSTAGGKKVTVSEEILLKIKGKFQDEVVSNVTPSAEPLPNDKMTFSTASGSAVYVSEDSLKKVRNKLSSDDFEIKNSLPEIQSSARTSIQGCSSMFITAGGNSVAVSEKSLQKVRNIFQDCSDSLSNETCSINISAQPTLSSHSALTTAGGSHVSISGETFKSIEARTLGSHPSRPSFSNAAGNKVEVSEESLLKVRNAFRNEFTVEDNPSPRASHIENNMDLKASFKTAGGSSLHISEESLRKVKNLFKDDFSDISSLKNTDTRCVTTLFSTGEGGSVNISEESLRSAKNQLVEEKVSRQEQSQDTIGVTEESLLRVKQIFSSKDTEKSPLERGFIFSTGLGNSVSVSDESLRNVQASHNELDQKISQKCHKESPRANASLEYTQSFANHSFNEELNRLEKLVVSSKPNEVIFSPEIVELASCETPVNCKNKSRSRSGNVNTGTNAPPKRLTYKSSQEAMVDFPSKSVLTSPSSFTDRPHMKPLIAWEFEYDSDDDILAAAQTPKQIFDSEPIEMNSEPLSDISKSIDNPEERQVCDERVVGVGMEDILEARRVSRENQKSQISAKSKNRPSISRGLYLSLRSERTLVKLKEEPFNQLRGRSYEELLEMGLSPDVINVTSKNAVDFKFDGTVYFKEECFSRNGFIDLGSDFVVILSDENELGLEEISLTFLACPSVDPALISQAWIKNHYRWIVWKLASLERSFPEIMSKRFLTPLNVLHQLKYRYDREIDSVERSAFKKILEGDEPASRRFIACVADIRTISSEELENRIELELTDGWYSCWTTLDPALADLTRRGRLRAGTKLVVHSAELLNSGDGSDPLELKESVRLRLHGNSCRRAVWSARLGFTRSPGPLPVSLGSVLSDGGLVGLLSAALVVRVYPLLFMSKDPNGKTVVRNSLAESQVAAESVKERTSKSEELYEKIFSEVEAKYKHGTAVKADLKNIKEITNPAVLYRLVSQESELHDSLSPEQLSMVKKYHEDITAKIQGEVKSALEEELKDLLPQRQVTSLLKMRIMDPETEASAMVTIWRPTEELTCLLTENSCIDFFALNACGTRDKVLQLSNTKQSRYRQSEPKRCGAEVSWRQFSRRLTQISELSPRRSQTSHQPPALTWGELDTAGVVVHVKRPDKPWGVTSVYLADLSDNFLMITFWTSLKVFGCEELLKEGSIVAAVNLHWRQGSGSYLVPSTFANELTYFYSHPTQEYLASEVTKLRKHFSGEERLGEFVERRKTALLRLVKERGGGSGLGSPGLIPRRPAALASPEIAKRLEKLQSYGPAPPLPTTPLVSTPDS